MEDNKEIYNWFKQKEESCLRGYSAPRVQEPIIQAGANWRSVRCN